MGDLVQLKPRQDRHMVGEASRPARKGKPKPARPVYVGLNVYIDAESEETARRIKRNVLHGILTAYDWHLTKGPFKRLFATGGMFRIRCKVADVDRIRGEIARRLPDLTVRRVLRSA